MPDHNNSTFLTRRDTRPLTYTPQLASYIEPPWLLVLEDFNHPFSMGLSLGIFGGQGFQKEDRKPPCTPTNARWPNYHRQRVFRLAIDMESHLRALAPLVTSS
jgi:hypothetical protein